MARSAVALIVFAVGVAGCPRNIVSDEGDRPSPAADSADMEAPPPARNLRTPSGNRLPTIVPLDWDAFPRDPGPRYAVKGRVWAVEPNGRDSAAGTERHPLKTITKALELARSGDLVRVHAGTYSEGDAEGYHALLIERPHITLTAAPRELVTVVPRGQQKRGLGIRGDHAVVNGINFSGFRCGIEVGLETRTHRDVVISNLRIDARPGDDESGGIISFEDTRSKGFPTMEGLLIKNVEVTGAVLSISCNGGPCKSWRLEDVKVTGNRKGAGSGADAIAIEEGDNMLFHRVEASQALADGIDTKATRVVVWGCRVHDVVRNGVKLWDGGDVVNTIIHHTGADAALVVKKGRVRLLHSLISHHNYGVGTSYNVTMGHGEKDPLRVEIINSIIVRTSGGMYLNQQSKVRIQSSLFFGMENGKLLGKGNEENLSEVMLAQGAAGIRRLGLGTGNLVADPRLDGQWRARPGSPAIDRGQVLNRFYPTTDIVGRPRVQGSGPDLGPFELR